jgi:putative cardiolipin synthase
MGNTTSRFREMMKTAGRRLLRGSQRLRKGAGLAHRKGPGVSLSSGPFSDTIPQNQNLPLSAHLDTPDQSPPNPDLPCADKASRLSQSVTPLHQSHPKESGIVELSDGRAAFAARVALADAAEHTLDIQYYIWHADMTGLLLFDAIRRAADRGVQVRLLLDDNNTTGLDPLIAGLNAHPNIQIRLFNAFRIRHWRALGYLTEFARLNRRMHNKSFTADQQVTLVGGRNIGDEYFEAGPNQLFIDLDILAIGPVVQDVSDDFERYWTSDSAWPAEQVVLRPPSADLATLTAIKPDTAHSHLADSYLEAITRQSFVRNLLAGTLQFEWTSVTLISDHPAKGLDKANKASLLWPQLQQVLDNPTQELALVSPYLVPAKAGVDAFVGLAQKGVRITLLTNSLEATDVVAVHAGYAKRRKPLLAAGIQIFELKRRASVPKLRDRGLVGRSGSSLHAKVFSVDQSHVFVGSFNFDPRSRHLNTEMGFLIASPRLAARIAHNIQNLTSTHAYQVQAGSGHTLKWLEGTPPRQIEHHQEPGATVWRRLATNLIARLPIEWLL